MSVSTIFRLYAVRKGQKLQTAKWTELREDTTMCDNNNCWTFAKGSLFKAFETRNAGWVFFHPDTKLSNGTHAFRRAFKE